MPIIRSFAEDGQMYFWDPGGPEKKEATGIPFEMTVRSDLLKNWDIRVGNNGRLAPVYSGRSSVRTGNQRTKDNRIYHALGANYAVPLIPDTSTDRSVASVPRKGQNADGRLYGWFALLFLRIDYTKEAFKFFNTLYREGLFDQRSVFDLDQQTKDKWRLVRRSAFGM